MHMTTPSLGLSYCIYEYRYPETVFSIFEHENHHGRFAKNVYTQIISQKILIQVIWGWIRSVFVTSILDKADV